MLACQRSLFEMPRDVCYLDAAAWAPLPRLVRDAGEAGILSKSRPWDHSRDEAAAWAERARAAAAALIGATADDIGIVGSVSHGVATAARNVTPRPGGRILRVADEFPSLCLAWDRMAAERGLIVEAVPRPADGDWTAALLAAVVRPDAPPLAVATLTPLHWSDGALIDLDRLAPAIHAAGAILVIDATQSVGALPLDVRRLKPDFLVFPTYKWTLGPYGVAFLYVTPHRQDGFPLEENAGNRPPVVGARRFDKGERNDPVALPMAALGMEMIAEWGAAAVSARLRMLTTLLADGAEALGLSMLPPDLRSAHVLGLRPRSGLQPDLIARLRAENIHVSARLGALRISPHVWADEIDVDRCLIGLETVLRQSASA